MISKKVRFWAILVIGIIIVCNIPIVTFFIGVFTGDFHFKSQADFEFTSGSGRFTTGMAYSGPEDAVAAFERYRVDNPTDSILYRNRPTINPLKFWMWRLYVVEDLFRIPYKEARNSRL